MDELVAALRATGYLWAHFGWSKAPPGDYGVYSEEGSNDLVADGRHVERATRLTVDFFTRAVDAPMAYKTTESGIYSTTSGIYTWAASLPAKLAIEHALDGARCAWYVNSIQFEPDTGYVHLEWVVECLG